MRWACSSRRWETIRVASRLAGVQCDGVKLACYVVPALLAGVAGLIATADIKAADVNNTGLYLELDAILAAAIGGTSLAGGRFSLIGSRSGALVIQTLTTTILARGVAPKARWSSRPPSSSPCACCKARNSAASYGDTQEVGMSSIAATSDVRRQSLSPGPRAQNLPLLVDAVRLRADLRRRLHSLQRLFSLQVAVNLIGDNAFLGIAAVGMTLVILAGGIDLSVGAAIGCTSIFLATGRRAPRVASGDCARGGPCRRHAGRTCAGAAHLTFRAAAVPRHARRIVFLSRLGLLISRGVDFADSSDLRQLSAWPCPWATGDRYTPGGDFLPRVAARRSLRRRVSTDRPLCVRRRRK